MGISFVMILELKVGLDVVEWIFVVYPSYGKNLHFIVIFGLDIGKLKVQVIFNLFHHYQDASLNSRLRKFRIKVQF